MNNEKLIKEWRRAIIMLSEERLGRPLQPREEQFIICRNSFVALEMIEETVRSLTGVELETYLNNEH